MMSFKRLQLIVVVSFVLFASLLIAFISYSEYTDFQKSIGQFKQEFLQKQKQLIKQETLRALRFIDYKYQHRGNKSLEALKKEIVDAIEHMRNERDGTGYIFIYTFDGVNVADPILKENHGKNLIGFKDSNGKLVIKELIDVSKRGDGGYVEYIWNKPLVNKLAPKISYAKSYEKLGWMVGSGVYLDTIESIVRQREHDYREKMASYLIKLIALSLLFLLVTIAILQYFAHLREKSLLKIRDRFYSAAVDKSYIKTSDLFFRELKEIADYANEMLKILQERNRKIEELNRTLENRVLKKTQSLNLQNRQLLEAKNRGEQLLQNQEKFLKTAIHEINTPLSIILTNIDLLAMDGITSRELANIESGIKIIQNVYDELVYIVQKDRLEYRRESIDLSGFLQERVEFFSSIALGNHLQLHTKIDKNLQLNINPIELQRLIDNNLSNAMKYSKPYSVVTVSALWEEAIILEFSTKSKPIKSQESLFEPHYQEELNKGGFGLGLSLVKEICQKYGYTIELLHSEGYNIFRYRLKEHTA